MLHPRCVLAVLADADDVLVLIVGVDLPAADSAGKKIFSATRLAGTVVFVGCFRIAKVAKFGVHDKTPSYWTYYYYSRY